MLSPVSIAIKVKQVQQITCSSMCNSVHPAEAIAQHHELPRALKKTIVFATLSSGMGGTVA